MKKRQKKVITAEIKDTKLDNIEERVLVSRYFMEAIHTSIKVFGFYGLTRDLIAYHKMFKNILKEETLLLNFVKRNVKKMDYRRCRDFLNILDTVNEQTIEYFYELIDNAIDACNTINEDMIIEPKKDFLMLLETKFYRLNAFSLAMDLDEVKNFLDYPEEFWIFIEDKIKVLDDNMENSKYFYGNRLKTDELGFLTDFLVIVPKITDIKTALINVHEFTHAFDLYNRLNTIIFENEEYFEDIAEKNESLFCNSYLAKKL